MGDSLRVGDLDIAYRVAGPPGGTPVLLLHGLSSRGATWDALVLALVAAGRRVVVPDLRGHGESGWPHDPGDYSVTAMAADVAALLDAVAPGRLDVVGHSLGGLVAWRLAQDQPARVRRLVIEDSPPPPRAPGTGDGLVDAGRKVDAGEISAGESRADDSPAAQPAAEPTAEPEPPTKGVDVFDWRSVDPIFAEITAPDPGWWACLPSVTAETLLLWGGPDSHVGGADMAAAADLLPNGRFVTVEGAGHRIHSLHPAAFAAVVLPFLAGP